ncbi:tyrosine-protein phosphatase 69D isoform X2 [Neocloeon triangulifer]|uniref:tyrosine-protein phosphatase 69D isoform X2 n=1 Tax=Neocloeon triangulifer TaxID=2078957 RepID=UPI00286F0E77|nr:tyrosine-protein phosphatase 69D isoform X2 [Neocloeon triangulifer]
MLSRPALKGLLWPLALLAFLLFPASADSDTFEQDIHFKAAEPVTLGSNATFICTTYEPESELAWERGEDGPELQSNKKHIIINDFNEEEPKRSTVLTITKVSFEDEGKYVCRSKLDNQTRIGNLTVFVEPVILVDAVVKVRANETAKLACHIKGYPIYFVQWRLDGLEEILNGSEVTQQNKTHWTSHLNVASRAKGSDNGTYLCEAGTLNNQVASSPVTLLVLDKPHLAFSHVKAIGSKRIFVNWTVNHGNMPIETYHLKYTQAEDKGWQYASKKVEVNDTSFVLDGLEPNKPYRIQLEAKNSIGHGFAHFRSPIKTLKEDPVFVPDASVSGNGGTSLTLKWNSPPQKMQDFIHYYKVELMNEKVNMMAVKMAEHSSQHIFHMLQNLEPATTYSLRVAACSEYTKECFDWSKLVEGKTMDLPPGPVSDLTVSCKHDNVSKSSVVFVSWAEPKDPRGNITRYYLEIQGSATFLNERGIIVSDTFGPKSKSVERKDATFENLPSNTNYSVKVVGVNTYRMRGDEAKMECQMPPTVPDKDKTTSFNWGVIEDGKFGYVLQLFTSRITERNGAICCYRVIVVKLGANEKVVDLPPPENTVLSSYDEVRLSERGGAYVAEAVDSGSLKPSTFIGDGSLKSADGEMMCRACFREPEVIPETTTVPPAPSPNNTTSPLLSALVGKKERVVTIAELFPTHVQDGPLDIDSQYTGFMQIIVHGPDNTMLQTFSNYFTAIRPNSHVIVADTHTDILSLALNITMALLVLVLILLLSICLVTRYSKSIADQQGVELSLRESFRHLCQSLRSGGGNGRVPVISNPPDMTPILRDDMPSAYQERHKDSDYGFQHEFELLPDRFSDRTTKASESRENLYKNRYPDIKSYDQTRVKLAQVEGVTGSDYINANFVIGYKERKKFICAQGPMENTVSDFWKMIWEQHLELVLMLTNLEEYSKTKCYKYWPDEGEKVFGDITVVHVQEKRYSDYIVRELKINQGSEEGDERSIVQYHYLAWKDFMAPEHPNGILKFIKRMNEVYSLEKGPILIHCSAGVGRTGTLVALDSLLQQIQEEGEVSVFNTVCDLRHQRNFLVQNLKQYIFVYRALVEFSQFGDTECKVTKFKVELEKKKVVETGKTKCPLEEEYEKVQRLNEEPKVCTIASGEENKSKNRSETILPYDRNRVILTPMPAREHSTYINASFIEGYDNSESFIITQDPLEGTIADFWRMLSEQGISTLVMLSDLKEGTTKCPRYWPDDEISHNHIKVKYSQSESGPYFTKREFNVTNCKTDESINVTQFQYNGWPTADGEMPSVARGLTDLVDHVLSHHEADGSSGPIAVHCHLGVDRSAIFVALAILIQQIQTEKRVDILSVVRKLRCQRQGMLDSYAQYEFLHRAVMTYIDLHHLAAEDT